MLAELLIVTPHSQTSSGEIVADLGIPSSTDEDATIACGTLTVPVQEHPISFVRLFIDEAFRHELELDGSIDDEGLKAEEDFIAQAILIELPSLINEPVADQITFQIITPCESRKEVLPAY